MITIIDHNDFNNCDINISLNDILSKWCYLNLNIFKYYIMDPYKILGVDYN